MSASYAIEKAIHASLDKCLELDSPQPEHMVVAVEYAQEKKGRRYAVIRGDDDGSAYDAVLEYLASHSDPTSRSNGAKYALHEVVRKGLPRRVMFDIDYNSPVSLEQLKSDVRLLQEAYAKAFEGYGNPWEIDLSVKSFSLTVSDDAAPFKGFHLLHTRVVMPAASVARIYALIKEILEETPAGRALAAVLDPKPATETFNMRLYGSPKFMRQPKRGAVAPRAVLVRQKRLLDEEDRVCFEPTESMRDYVIQPAPGLAHGEYCIYEVALHADDEQVKAGASAALDLTDAALARLSYCELLNGWEARGEVKTGEFKSAGRTTTWWRLDLTLVDAQRQLCSVCNRVHENRTDYLWLTGEGLVDETKPIYVRCRARSQTSEEKAANNYRFNVVVELPGTAPKRVEIAAPTAPVLTYAFSFEGYTGKPLKTPLTTFLDAQKNAHLVAIEAADRSAATKRAEKARLNADLATAVAHQQNVMQRALEAEDDAPSPLYDALKELKRKGADYAIHGRQQFDDLAERVYENEYEMLCAIHCNAWTHDQEGAAIWDDGQWTSKNWDEKRIKDIREQMLFRTTSGAKYAGSKFWRTISAAYARNSQTSFTPHPLGRSAIGLPSPSLWRMRRGINNYAGLYACTLPQLNPDRLVRQQHRDVFEHFLRSQIAGEGDEYYRYLMGWLASAMQRPHEKIGVALLIRGPMGCGKSILISLLSAIVPHATTVTNKGLRTLTDKFNTDLENRTLYMFGEVGETTRAGLTGDQIAAIKTLITDDVQEIEAKFKAMKRQKQYLNIIVCSNMLNCIETGEGDRRWCVMDTSCPVHDKDDLEYWKRVYPLFTSDKSFAASIQELLLDYDIPASGFEPKEYPKSEALQVTRRELPIVNYALRYPNLRQRVTEYLRDKPEYEPDRPATLRDIVICQRVDEGSESSRADSVEQQERDLYYAMSNIPQVKQRFSSHPDSDGGRMTRITAAGRQEVLKLAIVWGEDDSAQTNETTEASTAVRDCTTAMAKMVAMMKAAGLDVSEFVRQFPILGDGPDRYDSMSKVQLLALIRERKITLVRNPPVALMRSKLRESDLKA